MTPKRRGRRSSNPNVQPFASHLEERGDGSVEEVPQNLEDFVGEVISRAREQNLAVEREYFYQQHNRGQKRRVLYPDDGFKVFWDWLVALVRAPPAPSCAATAQCGSAPGGSALSRSAGARGAPGSSRSAGARGAPRSELRSVGRGGSRREAYRTRSRPPLILLLRLRLLCALAAARARQAVFASLLTTPYILGFSDRISPRVIVGALGTFDVIWWLDILITFRTAIRIDAHQMDSLRSAASHSISMMTHPHKIAAHYLSTYFTLDVIAALPYYMFLFANVGLRSTRLAGAPQSYQYREALSLASLLPLINILRLSRIFRAKNLSSTLYIDSDGNQLVRLVILFFYLSHVNGCYYWLNSIVMLRHGLQRNGELLWSSGQDFLPPRGYASFLPEGMAALVRLNASGVELGEVEVEDAGLFTTYLYVIVWGMLNVSGVNLVKPTNLLQTLNSLLVVSCSILTNAVIIGSVTTTLSRLNYARHNEHQKKQAIEAHMRRHDVPQALRRRVHAFYTFMGGVAEATPRDQLLPALPRGLAFQLDLLQKSEVFTKVPFFSDLTHEQIIDLVPRCLRMFAMPGRTLIREGKISAGLYMIARGRVRILRDGVLLNERIVGEFLGERSLIHEAVAAATCVTSEFCELFLLRRPDFMDLVQRYPEMLVRIKFFAERKDKASHQGAHLKLMRLQESQQKLDDSTGAVDDGRRVKFGGRLRTSICAAALGSSLSKARTGSVIGTLCRAREAQAAPEALGAAGVGRARRTSV